MTKGTLVIPGTGMSGHRFSVHLDRRNQLWKEQRTVDCKLEWWELWVDYTGGGVQHSWYPQELLKGEWVDFVPAARKANLGEQNPFKKWEKRDPGRCPGRPRWVTIRDTTRLVSARGRETTRTIYFYVRLVSSCPKGRCRHEAVAACAVEEIKYDANMVPTTRSFERVPCSPGTLPSFPPNVFGSQPDGGPIQR